MAIKLVAARKHRAARLACCSMPFMASTKALDRLSSMPLIRPGAARVASSPRRCPRCAPSPCHRARLLNVELDALPRGLSVQRSSSAGCRTGNPRHSDSAKASSSAVKA